MKTTPDSASALGAPGWFAERRVTLRERGRVRHFAIGRGTQIAGALGLTALVGWTAVSAVALGTMAAERGSLVDRVEALEAARDATAADLAARHAAVLEAAEAEAAETLATLRAERDAYRTEAADARSRLATLSRELGERQARLIEAADTEAELGLALDSLRARLRDAVEARDAAELRRAALAADLAEAERRAAAVAGAEADWTETIAAVTAALEDTAAAREAAELRRGEVEVELETLLDRATREAETRARLYDRLKDAVDAGLGGLERAISDTGLDPDAVVEDLRGSYAGEGGPFLPLEDAENLHLAAADNARVAALLGGLERASLLRVAASKLPMARPVRVAHRFTSGFGARRDPIRGVMRMHTGADFAARRGTPIHATADGVVAFAGWQSGYGRVVKIRHAFGFETVYSHLDKARVAVGDRVAQGDRIGDMGRTGRVTGVHLHYEVRVNGRPVNPLKYIEAARNVL